MSQKMIKCTSCGNDIANSAKNCPNCGAKNKKPIFKKWLFWVIIVFAFIVVISMAGGDSDPVSPSGDKNVTQTSISVSADILIRAYVNNSVSADEVYKDKNVTVSGTIYSIEDGYIIIEPDSEDLWLNNIYVYYSSSEKSKLSSYTKGDKITVTGECKGEGVFGDVEIKYCIIN